MISRNSGAALLSEVEDAGPQGLRARFSVPNSDVCQAPSDPEESTSQRDRLEKAGMGRPGGADSEFAESSEAAAALFAAIKSKKQKAARSDQLDSAAHVHPDGSVTFSQRYSHHTDRPPSS